MKAQDVELVLLEQSMASTDGMNRPFHDRVGDVAEKTGGTVSFDVRVDEDTLIQRIAAIGYGADGVVAIVLDRKGVLTSAPVVGSDDLIAELTTWGSLPMAGQVGVSYVEAAARLLTELRKAGFLK